MLVHYSSSPTIKIIQQEIVQFLLLILIVAAVCLTIFLDVMVLEHGVGERSLTEYYQQILIFSVACCFAYAVKRDKANRHFHVLVMGFFTCMLIRELDSFFDQIVHGFWLYPALLVFVTCSLYASRNNRSTLEGLAQFTRHRNFQSIVTALVIILIFSRLFGMGELWEAILADNYIRLAKNIAEEGTELLGYSLLFFSSIGYVRSLPHSD